MELLPREKFRDAVFCRDGHHCVRCGRGAEHGIKIDAHHILERRLWPDGGYYLDNGATLCDEGTAGCHWMAETTALSVEEIREMAGITVPILPPDFYGDGPTDKWGNPLLEDGRRAKGPLFADESVQYVLSDVLSLFSDRVKYARTWHLPWSPGFTSDDRVIDDCTSFHGREVVVTRKLDGENFTGYQDAGSHARAIGGRPHPTRAWARAYWARRAHDLPSGWRFCGENLYAVKSIAYTDLPGYLMGFSIWDDTNTCLSWDDTRIWMDLLDIPTVPEMWRGVWDEAAIRALHTAADDKTHEGYVVRLAEAFSYSDFSKSLAKYVRAGHLGTDRHWRHRSNHPANGLAQDAARY